MNAVSPGLAGVEAGAVPVKRRRRLPPRGWLVLGAALLIGTGGVLYLRAAKGAVSTDNAYVKSDITLVAPRVRGHVAELLVAENEAVKAGQVLVRLDPEEYAARVAGARGDLALADANIASAQATLTHLVSETALAEASVREAQTSIRASDAQAVRAEADRQRYAALVRTGYVPRRDAERVEADATSAAAAADRSRAALAVSRSQEAMTRDRRGELEAALAQARAGRAKAQAALDLALQDQVHAEIRAPIAGVVGDRQAHVGDFVQPGSHLLTLVPMDRLYLTANFKETQTDRMLRGQVARVEVDALPGVTLKAHVESFAPGSGSEFALLPFEPGVGNFTKIVQRVPVRLRFDAGQPELAKLRPGLSAKVTVALSNGG
jgi:membrane fusion protein (multidrug efflux system)